MLAHRRRRFLTSKQHVRICLVVTFGQQHHPLQNGADVHNIFVNMSVYQILCSYTRVLLLFNC